MRKLACALMLSVSAWAAAADVAQMQPPEVIAKYGVPDRYTTSENERPRPPIVTKTIEYSGARVRFVFVADAPMGAPPPYKRWRLLGATDPSTNGKIDQAEVDKRMKGRAKR